MQAVYPKSVARVPYDTLNVVYPVNKTNVTGDSSTTIGHKWRPSAEILRPVKSLDEELKLYSRDYNITKELTRSQTTVDFGYKEPESKRFYKHSSCMDNHYIYPTSRQLEERVPAQRAFGTTEMRSSYQIPVKSSRLVTDKNQFKHVATLPSEPAPLEPSWHKDLEPINTAHEGFEKYLDPYLTTSRLEHRPFTADQLARPSVARDIVTYYTFSDTPFVRTPKPKAGDWWLPLKRPKSALTYDRAKFKQDFREIITHNKPFWVPGTFRTEARDNYVPQANRIQNFEEDVKNYYERSMAHCPTNISAEKYLLESGKTTENATVGSRKPIAAVFNQFVEKNIRLSNQAM